MGFRVQDLGFRFLVFRIQDPPDNMPKEVM